MKKIVLLLLALSFSCCSELDPVETIISEHIEPNNIDVNLNIEGIGITESSFARTSADWVHPLSGIDAEVHITKFDEQGFQRFESIHPYNTLNDYTANLSYGDYLVYIPQKYSSTSAVTFTATSDTITIGSSTRSIDMKASTAQCLILLDSDMVCTDSIPYINSTQFNLRNGFWYLYTLEIANDLKYIVKFCTATGSKEVDLVGARRETIYFINIDGEGDVTLNLGLDSLFTSTILIN